MKALDKKITKGLGWTSLATFGNQGLRLLLKLVLAKLLLPEHYGLIGMASIFISFVTLISELGMGAALIQKPEEQMNEKVYHTAFWTNFGVSVVGFLLILVAGAPLAALFYNESILIKLVPVLAVPIILDSLYLIPKVKLSRNLDFKPQAIREIVSVAIAGIISISLALQGYGVWALAFNGIIISIISILLYYKSVKWWPKFIFDKEEFRSLFGFGGYVMVERMFSFFTANTDYILIGKLIGSSALGVYTLAFILTDTFRRQFQSILSKVLFPAYSSIQHDVEQLRKYFLVVIKMNGIFLYPLMTLFFVLAKPIILYFFGEEWRGAVFPLRMLSLAVIVHVIGGTTTTIMRSMGKANLMMRLSVLSTIFITVPAITIGAITYGINGVAVSVLVNKILTYLIYQKYIYRELKLNLPLVLKQFSSLTLACIVIGLAIHCLHYLKLNDFFYLVTSLTVSVLMYGSYLWFFERELMYKVKNIVQQKSKNKKNKVALSNQL